MEATIAVLLQLGFKLQSITLWVAPSGLAFSVSQAAKSNGGGLLNEVRRLAEHQTMMIASKRQLGGGLEEGPPFLEPALEARAKQARQAARDEVKALDAVVCGGLWPKSHELRCHRCGAPDSPRHRFYTCEELLHATLLVVRETTQAVTTALTQYPQPRVPLGSRADAALFRRAARPQKREQQ